MSHPLVEGSPCGVAVARRTAADGDDGCLRRLAAASRPAVHAPALTAGAGPVGHHRPPARSGRPRRDAPWRSPVPAARPAWPWCGAWSAAGHRVIALDADPLAAGLRLAAVGVVVPAADDPGFGEALLGRDGQPAPRR